jgi:tetratricopeptide (TPR) repeat protein
MSSDIEAWPPPDDPAAFESLCLDLWKEIWGSDSHAQKNGRSGQPQAGVDVFGTDREGRQVGVQCKQKSGLIRSKVTVADLEEEVEKARSFLPSLSLFVVATTGPRDVAVQERARTFGESFAVEVWSWPDLWREIYRRGDLLNRIGRVYWPRLFEIWIGQRKTAPTRLTHVAEELIGREKEQAALDAAWADPKIRVITLAAWGGVGKTSLVGKWAAERDLGGADYFDWSFYSQGTKEEGSASGEPFLNAALRFFGDEEGEKVASSKVSAWDKGAQLAGFVARRRALLILDGLEPLQYPVSSPLAGQLKDPGVTALLRGLAANNPGLCVVTTRESVKGVPNFHSSSAPEWSLERLSTEAGVALLKKLGVWGSKADLEQLVEDVKGHALTINLLGTYLAKAHKGDVRRRDRVDLKKADEKVQGGHAFRAIEAYERWLISEGKDEGARQLAILRLLGLFDRPADEGCVKALRQEPAIPGLTDAIAGLGDEDWTFAVTALVECGLLSSSPAAGTERGETLDAHPLLREYFAEQLKKQNPKAWRAAHGQLFEHLRDTTPHQPDTLEGLQPLYQAVAHGCQAGRYEEARAKIYQDRISRGAEDFVVRKLEAFGADLGAVACFFDLPWSRVSPALSEADQAWLLNSAAFNLRALGRLTEALEPMRAGLEAWIGQENWKQAAISASNLSELELTLGEVAQAEEDAVRSVTFADRSGDAFQKLARRSTHANVLHQAGQWRESRVLFAEAERMQAEWQPEYPRLYSLRGFEYCGLLLAEAEHAVGRKGGAEAAGAELFEAICEVEERAAEARGWANSAVSVSILDLSLIRLTLGRAALYRSILERSAPAAARAELEVALDGLRHAGDLARLPWGLLTRAWLNHEEGQPEAARADLDEAQEIAERGPMPLFLADIALYRGRLFGDRAALVEARRLIVKHGYGRRLGELEDAEAALATADAASG